MITRVNLLHVYNTCTYWLIYCGVENCLLHSAYCLLLNIRLYLFLHHAYYLISYIVMGSQNGRGNRYKQLVKVL